MGNTSTKQAPIELDDTDFNCVSTQTDPMSINFMLKSCLTQFQLYSLEFIYIFKQKYFI